MAMAVGVFIMFMLTVFRYYGDVEYRLNLNYRRYFIYYLLIGIGYLAGFGIYYVTGQWVWIYLIGEGAALVFVGITGNVFHQFLEQEQIFFCCTQPWIFPYVVVSDHEYDVEY